MIDASAWFDDPDTRANLTLSPLALGMEGSAILAIAGEIGERLAAGEHITNLTIGDFSPSVFRIPARLEELISEELAAGQTNYPPAIGIPELRKAVREFYKRHLGLDYPDGCVQIGSGARPPIFAMFATLLAPGDQVIYAVPSWNNSYYAYLNRAEPVKIVTRATSGFMPTLADIQPYLSTARLLCLNSPQNPSGTLITKEQLTELCEAIVAENRRREAAGERVLMVFYDQVYWQLTHGEGVHYTPPGVVPEMVRYTVLVDAISKSWAGTGLRVGWAVMPPWVRQAMKAYVGHMGAWAARAEQRATARFLDEDEANQAFVANFREQILERLLALRDSLWAMRDAGLPVDALDTLGAIYLSARFDLIGRTLKDGTVIETDDDIRKLLLRAGVAVVPFTCFGYPEGSGWMRMSIGTVTVQDCKDAMDRVHRTLADLL